MVMAHSLLDLGSLIAFQLERLQLDELNYKDEFHLQKQLLDLDIYPCLQRRVKHADKISNQQHQALQVPESLNTERIGSLVSADELSHQATATTLTFTCQRIQSNQTIFKSNNIKHKRLSYDKLPNTASSGAMAISFHSSTDSENPADVSALDKQKEFRSLVLEWFHQLRVKTDDFKSDEESRRMREAGNDSYRKERHALKACDLYTEAIFLAPSQDSIAAAMAHANRSTVLHDCGMYEQSYDDCLCALDLGYPEEYHPLIKLRQATCALKQRLFSVCEKHLHELLHMDLSETLETRTHELWNECELVKAERIEMGVQTGYDLVNNASKVYEVAWLDNNDILKSSSNCAASGTTKISVTTAAAGANTKSAYLKAIVNIPNNTIIFVEEAAVFVPSGSARICDHCGSREFIPFPCIFCSNRSAVYCSRKCRAAHASIHALECYAHQIELFEEFGMEFSKPRLLQLAFRMLINGLPQIVPHCRKSSTAHKMWYAFNNILNERNCTASSASLAVSSTSYSALLKLDAYMDKEDKQSMVAFAIIAHILAIYLSEYTDFFELLELTMPAAVKLTRHEWELLASALLLRHICQLRHKHLVHCPSFVLPADMHVLSPNDEFTLWETIRHIRRGQLHLLTGDVATVAYAVFPQTVSHCRQSCDDIIYRKISGRKLTAYSTKDIFVNSWLTNCFIKGNYRQALYECRQQQLESSGLQCNCNECNCLPSCPNDEYYKFHRYRCDNPNCEQIFTPTKLKWVQNLQWWKSNTFKHCINKDSASLICDICKQPQKLEWYWTFQAGLNACDAIEERCKLYSAIERANSQLIDMHEFKVVLARQLVEQCLQIHREGSKPLDEWEFNKLGSIMRSALICLAAQYQIFSIEYVQHMSYFWDVMALSKYRCGDKELMEMLQALEYIPDDYKDIFINYYEDFIAPKYLEENYTNTLDTKV